MNWKVRIKNPLFWLQVGLTFVFAALSYNHMDASDLNTWGTLINMIIGVVKNPFLLFMCLNSVWSAAHDPTTSGLADSAQALTYSAPKKETSYDTDKEPDND